MLSARERVHWIPTSFAHARHHLLSVMVLTVRVSSKYYNHTLPGTIMAVQSVATPTSFYHSVPDKRTRAVNHFLPYWALALCIGHLECVKIELNIGANQLLWVWHLLGMRTCTNACSIILWSMFAWHLGKVQDIQGKNSPSYVRLSSKVGWSY